MVMKRWKSELCKVMVSMSRSRPPSSSPPDRPASPQVALDALLDGDANDPGERLLRRAMWLEAIDRQIRPILPVSLAAHARLANIDDGRLVFLVDGPVWHARMRLAATEVLDAARSIGLEVKEVVVKTATSPSPLRPSDATTGSMASTTPAKPLSAAARDAMRAAIEAGDNEPPPAHDS